LQYQRKASAADEELLLMSYELGERLTFRCAHFILGWNLSGNFCSSPRRRKLIRPPRGAIMPRMKVASPNFACTDLKCSLPATTCVIQTQISGLQWESRIYQANGILELPSMRKNGLVSLILDTATSRAAKELRDG
jgi:hypothetical protein